MKNLDARRLTGINVIWQNAGAVVDVALDRHEDPDRIIALWHEQATRMLTAVGWTEERTRGHHYAGGVALALSAPIDCLYAAVEIAEWAYTAVEQASSKLPPPDFQSAVTRLRAAIAAEQNPPLIALAAQAAEHDVMFLWDDDEASVGLGRGVKTWPVTEIAAGTADSADWANRFDVPVVLVTGTNGKTTTVRLAQRILRSAGLNVGLSSTDWIGVNDQIIERGDYSGPGGARAVLRQSNVDAAVLETARGGLLRRGLGVPRADAALITNVTEDHLGDFGSQNLQELLVLKWVVTQALDDDSVAILNADDPLLVQKSVELSVPICWFSLAPDHPVLRNHLAADGQVVTVQDQAIVRFDGRRWHTLCAVNDIPITLDGTARHNIANALGAVAIAHAAGADDAAIVTGLTTTTLNDNPGRCNFFRVNGCDVLLDFAHNPSAMAALFDIARHHPVKRRILCFGQAGDRTDASIRELAARAWAIGLDHVIISELACHYRGREAGEVFALLRKGLIEAGATPAQISHNELESESLAEALDRAAPGDLIIMLALADARNILSYLTSIDERGA